MAHHDHHSQARHTHGAGEPFSASEIEKFHIDDRIAARAIVTLMLAVFSIGLIGSIAISIVVGG